MNNSIETIKNSIAVTSNKTGQYSLIKDTEEIGYYVDKNKIPERISNFFINLDKCIKGRREKTLVTYYEGEVIFSDGARIGFDNLSASCFAEHSSLHKYLEHLCGSKAIIYGSPKDLSMAIKQLNSHTAELEEREFGYNEDLSAYYSGDLRISADEILEKNTPIKYKESWGNNKLGFNIRGSKSTDEIKNFIINKFLEWDSPVTMFPLLAFALFPIIYPLLKDKNPNKFHMMLKGHSGSGKTQMCKWIQSFYGTSNTLCSWTSTDLAINLIGMAYKDSIFVVDDLKLQNLRSEKDINKAQGVIQNHSDGNCRSRSGVDLKLADEIPIKGHLLISAEDLVFTEASTVARGININVKSKACNREEISEIDEMAKEFQSLTPQYIQYVLREYDKTSIAKIFDESHKWISEHPLINDPNISPDNLPRLINNFAALKTSWEILKDFLFSVQLFGPGEFPEIFNRSLIELLLENIQRISDLRPDSVFESSLWEMIENDTLRLIEVSRNGSIDPCCGSRGNVVGYYTRGLNDEPRLVINIKAALRELTKRLPNFAISEETLVAKLMTDGKITLNPAGKVSLNGYKARGATWIGEFPMGLIGLKEVEDPVSQANAILNESNEVNFML